MKRLLIIITIGLLLVNCKEKNRTDYVLEGKAEGVMDGMKVYLRTIDEKSQKNIVDSTVVFDEKFKLQGKVVIPEVHFLEVEGVVGSIIFMLENNVINIEVAKQNITESKVEGSESNKSFIDFQEGMLKIREEGTKVMAAYRKVKMPEDAAKKDSLTNELQKLGERLRNHPSNFIKENNDSYFSLSLIELEANEPQSNISDIMESYKNLTPKLRETSKGKIIGERLEKLYQKHLQTELP